VAVAEEIGIVVPADADSARRPLRGKFSRRSAPLLDRVRADVALVEGRPHERQAPLFEVRGGRTSIRVHAAARVELRPNLISPALAAEVRGEDRPVEEASLDKDRDAVSIVVEWRHLVCKTPDLVVVGVEDVGAMRFVEHSVEMLGADEPAGYGGALVHDHAHPVLSEAVSDRAAGEPCADDEDGHSCMSRDGRARLVELTAHGFSPAGRRAALTRS